MPGALMRVMTPTLAICCAAFAVGVAGTIFDLGADDAPAGTYGDSPTITIKDFAFSELLTIPGTKVVVTNLDVAEHTVTADAKSFTSGRIDGNAAGSFTAPDAPGKYTFFCEVHPSMVGTLVVATP